MAIHSVAIRRRTTMTSMPQPVGDDQDSSRIEEIILGADTHQDLHVAAVITALGVLRETKTFPASAAGYDALLSWAGTFGILRRAGVECTGSYGAALARHLRQAGIEVIEVNQPDKANRRRQGKTDSLDAEAAARAVLSGRARGSAEGRRRASGDAADVQAGQVFRHQGPYPGDQSTQSRDHRGRSPAARNAVWTKQPAADSSPRATGHRHPAGPPRRRRLPPGATGSTHPAPPRRDPRAGTTDPPRRHQPHSPIADPLRRRPRQRRRF